MSGGGLNQARELVATELETVDSLMSDALQSGAVPLKKAVEHLLTSGGKRIRALLCLLSGGATGVNPDEVAVVAAGAEMIHAASLCHDDVLDQGDLRRGRPTIRVLFGDPMSILLGDFCLTRAMRLLADHGLSRQVVSLADAVVEMAEGEVAQAGQRPEGVFEADHYLEVAAGKTGSLLCWCATLGGLVSAPHCDRLSDYGYRLGRVYQIADDLLDFGNEESSGKKQGQDLISGGLTMPLLVALELREELRERLTTLWQAKTHASGAIEGLIAEIRRSGALERTRALARSEAEQAVQAVRGLEPSPYRDALADLARFAADRNA